MFFGRNTPPLCTLPWHYRTRIPSRSFLSSLASSPPRNSPLDSPNSNTPKQVPALPKPSRRTPTAKPTAAKPSGNFLGGIVEQQRVHQPHLLMARVGDFYEFYGEQAPIVSQALGLKIARASSEQPFCGFPVYKVNDYVKQLLDAGFSIAKYEQYENLQANGERVLVRRVDRIYTPGTLLEEEFVDQAQSNHLLALDVSGETPEEGRIAFACVDLSSGEFHMDACPVHEFPHKLAFIQPKEVLLSPGYDPTRFPDPQKICGLDVVVTREPQTAFDPQLAFRYLANMFGISAEPSDAIVRQRVLRQVVPPDVPQCSFTAASALLQYVVRTHSGVLPLLDRPSRYDKDVMAIDMETQKSLELTRTIRRGDRSGTLLKLLDGTTTSMGTRMLTARVGAPSASLSVIEKRHDLVQLFFDSPLLNEQLTLLLQQYFRGDAGRAIQNLKFNYGGPWHLGILLETFWGLRKAHQLLSAHATGKMETSLQQIPDRLVRLLESVLAVKGDSEKGEQTLQELPRLLDRPGILRAECNRDLLDARNAYVDTCSRKEALTRNLRETFEGASAATEIRLESKKPLGAYVEVETAHSLTIPASHQTLIQHLQTLGGSSKTKRRRYRVLEWTQLDTEINQAYDHYLQLERTAFKYVCEEIYQHRDAILQAMKAVAELDVASSLARKAKHFGFVRPKMVAEPVLEIVGGRHPVVEDKLRKESLLFQQNDCVMRGTEERFWLITGPNMGGKSTFLRQNALIAILAQVGSFVPAESATIGIVDRIFSRVGSSDDLSRHQSSFMVEMSESAFILHQATPRSLVIMDEVGRGTSFSDGLSVAWGIIRHLRKRNQCRTLFATHYHELAQLLEEAEGSGVSMWRTRVVEAKRGDAQEILFTHQLEPGCSGNSYGIHVARLAGVPEEVISDAQEMLQTWKEGNIGRRMLSK